MLAGSYGYRYSDTTGPDLLRLLTIGRQKVEDPSYVWDGMKREGDGVIFQYTLSGEGRLTVNRQTYRIGRGQAFFVTVPSNHRYYFDAAGGDAWEFIWIRISGMQASSIWKDWMESEGPVSEFRTDSETIQGLQAMYECACNNSLGDRWSISVRLYEWLLTLMKRRAEGTGRQDRGDIPSPYRSIADWMAAHAAEDLSLEQLADRLGVTRHHFCRTFREYYGMSPIQFLRNKRVEAAAKLLRQSSLPIGSIAKRCGYADLGYFGKVFHQLVGVSPSKYRSSRTTEPGDTLKLL